MSRKDFELPPEALKWTCDPEIFPFETTQGCEPLTGIMGQDRAARALDFGLGIDRPGFNIYVAGIPGSGRTSISMDYCERRVADKPVPNDWVYVHNFRRPDRPTALSLPAGMGKKLGQNMEELLQDLLTDIPKAFEGEDYERERSRAVEESQAKQQALFRELEEEAEKEGFLIRVTQGGFVLGAVINGQTLSDEQYSALNSEVREEIEKKRLAFNQNLGDFFKKMRGLEKGIRERARALQREVGIQVIGVLMQALREDYAEFPEVLSHFDQVRESILSRLDEFRKGVQESPGESAVKAEGGGGGENAGGGGERRPVTRCTSHPRSRIRSPPTG